MVVQEQPPSVQHRKPVSHAKRKNRERGVTSSASFRKQVDVNGGAEIAATETKTAAAEAVPTLMLKKAKSQYVITMNQIDNEGRINEDHGEPVVFRLWDTQLNDDSISSSSSFDMDFVTPAGLLGMQPKPEQQNVQTEYDLRDLIPEMTKSLKKGVQKVTITNPQIWH